MKAVCLEDLLPSWVGAPSAGLETLAQDHTTYLEAARQLTSYLEGVGR